MKSSFFRIVTPPECNLAHPMGRIPRAPRARISKTDVTALTAGNRVWNAHLAPAGRMLRARDLASRVDWESREPEMPVTEEQVFATLRECFDPEIPVNIVDLGLIYEISIGAQGAVSVQMTLTSPNCPAGISILDQVKQRVAAMEGAGEVTVNLVWEPAWDPSRISAEARKQLGIDSEEAAGQ